jgi:hypothetical protein
LEKAHDIHGDLSQGPDLHPGRATESWHSLCGSTKSLNPLRTVYTMYISYTQQLAHLHLVMAVNLRCTYTSMKKMLWEPENPAKAGIFDR